MAQRGPRPRLDHISEDVVGRVLTTISCTDADSIPKVNGAGEIVERDGVRLQVMHNGVVVEEGCYYGPWMTEIIRSLRGHHEPQEELVFNRIIDRLCADEAEPSMIEFGSFWSYYSLWFAKACPAGHIVAMEPDPNYLQVGIRNFALNGLAGRAEFVHGAIGAQPGEPLEFMAESDGATYQVMQHDLRSLMVQVGMDSADVVLADVQGAETILLERARDDFSARRVRFIIVSTHHHSISGSPLTHQHALSLLEDVGAHIIAEHTVAESYSGDGLIAASFDERDKDFTVELSRARARDSLFGELEPALDAAFRRASEAERHANELRAELAITRAERDRARQEVTAVRETKLWRWSLRVRQIYGRFRRR